MQTLKEWIDYAGVFTTNYPVLAALIVAIGLSWPPGIVWDNWFAPDEWKPRKVKQVSLAMTMIIAVAVSIVCWHSFDPADAWATVIVISIVVAMGAPLFHLVIGTLLDHFVPWLHLDATLKKAPA